MLEALGQTTWKHRGREVELTIELPEAEAAARVRPLLRQFAIGAVDAAGPSSSGCGRGGGPRPTNRCGT